MTTPLNILLTQVIVCKKSIFYILLSTQEKSNKNDYRFKKQSFPNISQDIQYHHISYAKNIPSLPSFPYRNQTQT